MIIVTIPPTAMNSARALVAARVDSICSEIASIRLSSSLKLVRKAGRAASAAAGLLPARFTIRSAEAIYCCSGASACSRAPMVSALVAFLWFSSMAARKLAECSSRSARMPVIAAASPVRAASRAARTSARRASCIISACIWLRRTSAIRAESDIDPFSDSAINRPEPEPNAHRMAIARPANFTLERIVESIGSPAFVSG